MRTRLPFISDRWRDFGGGDQGAEKGTSGGRLEKGTILKALGGGGRPSMFLDAVANIRPSAKPTLNFAHVLLPHEPRQYLQDGRSYQQGADPDPSLDGPESFNIPFLAGQAHQRELLQLGYLDRLVGRLIDHLEQPGFFDNAPVLVL